MELSGDNFKEESPKDLDNKNNPTKQDQQSCRKIPIFILSKAYHNATSQIDKDDISNHIHSEDNIFYSLNKEQNSQHENDLKYVGYTQESVQVKGGQIEDSLLKLRQKSEIAAAFVLTALVDSGPGYTQIASNLDECQFNNPSEKHQIKRAKIKHRKSKK
ncbi:hypothetical protein ACTFIY_008703 [Dictyostelium cf. discoideum]